MFVLCSLYCFFFLHNSLPGVVGPKLFFAHNAIWSCATTVALLHDIKPKASFFFSVVLHQVSIGLHCHPFLTRAQVNSILGLWLAFILRMSLMNLQYQWYLTLLQIPNLNLCVFQLFSKLVSVFYASVLLLIINCIITLSKSLWNRKPQVSGSMHSELQMTLL